MRTKTIESLTPVREFLLQVMSEFPEQEMTRRDFHNWYVETKGHKPPWEGFHMRDALYALETQGLVERVLLPDDKAIYWRIVLTATNIMPWHAFLPFLPLPVEDPVASLEVH